MEKLHIALQIEDFLLQVVGVCVKLLSDSHRNCILQLCTSHLDGVGILLSLVAESADKSGKSAHEMSIHADEGEADGCRINIICTLSAVAMVVRRNIQIVTLLASQDFKGTVGDHLISIHIDRSSSTTLYHVDREILVPLAVYDFAASLSHSSGNLIIDNSERMIGLGSCQLHVCNSDDEIRIITHRFARDMIIVNTALSLYTVKCVSRNFEFT